RNITSAPAGSLAHFAANASTAAFVSASTASASAPPRCTAPCTAPSSIPCAIRVSEPLNSSAASCLLWRSSLMIPADQGSTVLPVQGAAFVPPFKVHLCWFGGPDVDPRCGQIATELYELLHRPIADDVVRRPGLEIPTEYGRDLAALLGALDAGTEA